MGRLAHSEICGLKIICGHENMTDIRASLWSLLQDDDAGTSSSSDTGAVAPFGRRFLQNATTSSPTTGSTYPRIAGVGIAIFVFFFFL